MPTVLHAAGLYPYPEGASTTDKLTALLACVSAVDTPDGAERLADHAATIAPLCQGSADAVLLARLLRSCARRGDQLVKERLQSLLRCHAPGVIEQAEPQGLLP